MRTLFALCLIFVAMMATARNPYRRDESSTSQLNKTAAEAENRMRRGIVTFHDLALRYASRERY